MASDNREQRSRFSSVSKPTANSQIAAPKMSNTFNFASGATEVSKSSLQRIKERSKKITQPSNQPTLQPKGPGAAKVNRKVLGTSLLQEKKRAADRQTARDMENHMKKSAVITRTEFQEVSRRSIKTTFRRSAGVSGGTNVLKPNKPTR